MLITLQISSFSIVVIGSAGYIAKIVTQIEIEPESMKQFSAFEKAFFRVYKHYID